MQNSSLPHSATSSIKPFDRAGQASAPSSPNPPRRLHQHLQTMVPLHARRRLNGYGTNDASSVTHTLETKTIEAHLRCLIHRTPPTTRCTSSLQQTPILKEMKVELKRKPTCTNEHYYTEIDGV